MSDYSEDILVEQPTVELLKKLGWKTFNCYNEIFGENGTLGRENASEVILHRVLIGVLKKINPEISPLGLSSAIEELARDRSAMTLANANKEIYEYLKNGIKVAVEKDREEVFETVKLIDWENFENNELLLTEQLWITGEIYKRRADLVGFVNGIPLVFIELKTSHKNVFEAFSNNLRDYKVTIPQLFWYNAFIILSNGSESLIGSTTSQWEHFNAWKKINSEGEEGIISLETMILGTCDKSRFYDIIENFIVYQEVRGGLAKILSRNHQYLGVNSAIEGARNIQENQGKLGVFWHTQGSGKSLSMVFFTQKILRKFHGHWTFLIVTDREDLDDQIFRNFVRCGVVTEKEDRVHAKSGKHLQELLKEDHRYLFTLIQKFRTDDNKQYPVLSERTDIIVITDEAHRTQYDTLALNMRNALPRASYIAFTGTPLIAGEEKTRGVFGDYVSIYNFKQSVDDGATVPLYYENRIPELQLINENFNDDMNRLLEEAELNEAQEERIEREFSREYHLITRDERLESVAEDIVSHFMGRGYRGKAMIICIDKATAVRMYDKVQKYWKRYIENLESNMKKINGFEKDEIQRDISFMEETDMAVVVSQSQNEVEDIKKKGADITPHRKRMIKEDLDEKFKDPVDPFRIVFVCAMWMTGFDAPSCSTLYLDKPMKNHTLMQTIARANRVYGDKQSGLIVDYIGVFKSLRNALAIYGDPGDSGAMPILDKQELFGLLKDSLKELDKFCKERKVNIDSIINSSGFERIHYMDDTVKLLVDVEINEKAENAVDKIILNDELKNHYLSLTRKVVNIFKAILPDKLANEFAFKIKLYKVLADKIYSLTPPPDINNFMESVENLLDKSIASKGYIIREPQEKYGEEKIDLSKIDFDKLRKQFEKGRKRIQVERLKMAIAEKLDEMVRQNKSRIDFLDKFQKMIAEYNSGAKNIEELFKELVDFIQKLNEEDKRTIAEELSQEELALFDLLTRPSVKLSKKEELQVKNVARELLNFLKKEKLVLDWRKKQQARASVKLCIDEILDKLPRVFDKDLYKNKCQAIYQHVYDSYFGEGKSVYGMST